MPVPANLPSCFVCGDLRTQSGRCTDRAACELRVRRIQQAYEWLRFNRGVGNHELWPNPFVAELNHMIRERWSTSNSLK